MVNVLRKPAGRAAALVLVAAAVAVPLSAGTADARSGGGSYYGSYGGNGGGGGRGHGGGGSTSPTDACGAVLAKPSGGSWSCSFVDDFDGTSLDTTKWVAQNSALSSFTVGATCFVAGEGYDVSGGALKLTVTKKDPFACNTPWGARTASYTGGAVSTYGKFSQAYGRFEARIAFPGHTDAGLHGGFWMNPQNKVYGAWPASGEIDVAEWFSGVADHVFPTLHYTGSTSADTGWNCVVGDVSTYHTYAVEWSRSKMDFLFDGQLCFSRSWAPTDVQAPAPFDQPFTASLLAAAGQGTNSPTDTMPAQATTLVDYVKVWS
ncbi:glycoside hydrolase family 16 protein [Nocardioides jejuensis]|uniref:Glycoside hydrolase family 16 protein n=1 Tax=Nocardioides jejuensis TaxID=2502782 RepID=A0A4R1BV53_9ACTN|nr:glycoside hydrolase family 16 protein [Nocardioides jejuensis]TCJ21840.1 glycoside hydrolase family 16 protein [Nocardioides jejuensis]